MKIRSNLFLALQVFFILAIAMQQLNAQLLQGSLSKTVLPGNSIACTVNGIHADNSYWRSFDLNALGISNDIQISNIEFGIEDAIAGTPGATIPMFINYYVGDITLGTNALTFLCGRRVEVADGTNLALLNFPSRVVVPGNSKLVVELHTPSGIAAGDSLFIGSNTGNQTGPSYISAVDCNVSQPTDLASLGFGNMRIVMCLQYGPAPVCQLGDADQNGVINLRDITAFVNQLQNGPYLCESDVNSDGVVDLLDVPAFIQIILNNPTGC